MSSLVADLSFTNIQKDDIIENDMPWIGLVKVNDAVKLLWEDNPKLHNIKQVQASIIEHGFQELPKFDGNLTNVKGELGAIKAGNGRIEALHLLQKEWRKAERKDTPRGVASLKSNGLWVMSILFGTDAVSRAAAMAYAIDSNNLTMGGGDFAFSDMARMWDFDKYTEIVGKTADAGGAIISLNVEDLQRLQTLKNFEFPELEETSRKIGQVVDSDRWPILRMSVPQEAEELLADLMEQVEGQEEGHKFHAVLLAAAKQIGAPGAHSLENADISADSIDLDLS